MKLDRSIDWLHHLSPTGNHERWDAFKASGYREAPSLTYPKVEIDLEEARRELQSLPITDVREPRFQALLRAKQAELNLQLELLAQRDKAGFQAISIELFGGVEAVLLSDAKRILETAPVGENIPEEVGAEEIAGEARAEIDSYREAAPDIWAEVHVVDDLNSMMMVNHGHLYIDRDSRLPEARLCPLIAHEVGVHVVTRYNGFHQPLHLFEAGTAHYDALQEGLGTFAEFVAGFLPPARLRVIAARVLACEAALRGEDLPSIFSLLKEEVELPEHDAFDTAVRALRGGGLTKDACYLRGLKGLLEALAAGEDFETFFCGKFDLGHLPVIRTLLEEGFLEPPLILPAFLNREGAAKRLDLARTIDLADLYQEEPCP
nr:tyrosine/phenylalanine carboxypeptidase domain-containing protein [Parvularcula maris]